MEALLGLCALIYILGNGGFAAALAHKKGYDPELWFLAGIFFPVISHICIAGSPSRIKPNF